MGVKHIKGSEYSSEGKGSIRIGDTFTMSDFERLLPSDGGPRRLMPCVYVVEKGKPYTYTAPGPSVIYIIEGEYIIEDETTSEPPIYLNKGDIAITYEGTVVRCSSPSKTKIFGVGYIDADTLIKDALKA